MKSTTFEFVIDWWFPFFIFSPSMIFFIVYALLFWNQPFNFLHMLIIFTLAGINFLYGYARMFLSKIVVSKKTITVDYFFIRWSRVRTPLIAMQHTYRFSPIGSMSVRQIALVTSSGIFYLNDVTDYARFRQLFLIDYSGQK